ncbi:Signal transduction histidine kinase [Streptomyces zhaozhouensis]|uniref:histidine kinase n=1 Tax=Streptomyces zhaozhouensis TaxID=1300267 RepID=A0A286EAN3_9ACTN|nr:nitrate- and nitrite sensing domain-containing protein [Streptomyces zhaozhouensis]SOD67963.1 Signal transduction histidine kinase [Streptomyces zhaozhouensis]
MSRSSATPAGAGEAKGPRDPSRGDIDLPGAPASGEATGSRFAPRNWRVATKLYAILMIPVVVALVLAGLRVGGSQSTWREAQDAERVAELVRASTAYAHALIDERDVTARPMLEGDREAPAVEEAQRSTDEARDEFHARWEETPHTESLLHRMEGVTEVEPQLETLRQRAYTDQLPGVETEEGYVTVQHPLMSFANELGLGTDNLTTYGRTVYALSLSKAASSLQRAIGTHLLVAPGPDAADRQLQLTSFSSYAYLEEIAKAEYGSAGTPQDVERLEERLARANEDAAADAPNAQSLTVMVQLIGSGADPEELAEQGLTPEAWFAAATAEFDAYRDIEQELVDAAVDEAREVAASARNDMLVNAAAVLAALLLAFLVAGLMARSMSRDMRKLRTAAFDVAGRRLPAVVDQLSRVNPGRVDTAVTATPVSSRDEIGEVARAFDQVHREAVRLAAEQALLRGNVNAIFTNLSSRNQGLIERQLALISELESREADPEQLENLFKLDHLATRMRRNGENLLVLAGEEMENRWNQAVPLVDVLRAAASEVEDYARIETSGVPPCEIHGGVVNDLVHLLAELLENATSFSSPQARVTVTATRLPDARVMIEIHDKGIGLSQEDFAEINRRLAAPPTVDAAISQRMGLFVVGRLAARHGIRVQLRPSGEQSGTTSLVMLPEAITHGGGGQTPEQEESFTVSRIMEEETGISAADREAGLRTAAELGFDDTRYGDPAPLATEPTPPRLPTGPVGQVSGSGQSMGDTMRLEPIGGDRRRPSTDGWTGPAPAHPGATPADPGAPAPHPARPAAPQGETAPAPQGLPADQDPYAAGGTGAGAWQQPPGQKPAIPQQPRFDAFSRSADSSQDGPGNRAQRVGFPASGPVGADQGPANDQGLPRRVPRHQRPEEETAQGQGWEPQPEAPQWDRGPRREERTGGTTSSGLPKRVPKANLTEHSSSEPTAPGGPQVSRDPQDVRGRLSSLRRGVQQGRGAGSGRGAQNDERDQGPGHTYEQER